MHALATAVLLAASTNVNVDSSQTNDLPGSAILQDLASGVGHWALIASVVGVIVGGVMWASVQQTVTTPLGRPGRR